MHVAMAGLPNLPWQIWQKDHELHQDVCQPAWESNAVMLGIVLLCMLSTLLFLLCAILVGMVAHLYLQKIREQQPMRCILQGVMDCSESPNGSCTSPSQASGGTSQQYMHLFHPPQSPKLQQVIDQYSLSQSSGSICEHQTPPQHLFCNNEFHNEGRLEMQSSHRGEFMGFSRLQTSGLASVRDSWRCCRQDHQVMEEISADKDESDGKKASYHDNMGVSHDVVLWEIELCKRFFPPMWEDFPAEVRNLLMLPPHANLLNILDVAVGKGGQCCLVLESGWVSLSDVIYKDQHKEIGIPRLRNKEMMKIFKGVVAGLQYLHEHNITENHLKTGSITLDEDFHPKIWGLGRRSGKNQNLSYMGHDESHKNCEAHLFTEIHSQIKAEIRNLGRIMWKTLQSVVDASPHRCNPPGIPSDESTCSCNGESTMSIEYPQHLSELIRRCLNEDSELRPSLKEVEEELNNIQSESHSL